jgi:acetyl esterase/lipase
MKYNCLFPDPATIKLDKRNVCVVSGMGGAAVAASLALRVRQAKEVEEVGIDWSLKGMFLYSPMLLCSSDTTSAAQFYKGDIWDTDQVQRMWSHYVKGELPVTTFECERHQHLQEGIKASPGMEDVLTDLPATYIDAGACETHRSEAVRRAEQMWCDGGDCELHIWTGACCNFTYWFPGLHVSKSAIDARRNWLERTLCGTP